jgi:hypothetical protein
MLAFIQGNDFRNTAIAVKRIGPLEETGNANTARTGNTMTYKLLQYQIKREKQVIYRWEVEVESAYISPPDTGPL